MLLNVAKIREAFPIFERQVHGKRLVFLDSAASSQKPRAVIEAIADVYRHGYANVHRGIYSLAEEATIAYEGARERVARFINAPEVAEVIWVRNATEALNLIAYAWGESNIGAGDRIVVTEMEHHANFVPWQQLAPRQGAELVVLPVTDGGELDLPALAKVLDQGDVRVVAATMMSNVLGTLPPIKQVIDMAREAGALTVVDAAQAAPHLPLDVQALGADFVVFSGHKMCGPGVGVLWGRREVLEAIPPFLYGGDMIRRVEKGRSLWNELPYKFEAGTPPIAEVVGMGAAVDFLTEIGLEKIHAHEQAVVAYALERVTEVPGLHVLGPAAERRGGVLSFWMEAAHPHDIASILDEEGVCIRAGHHCAQPLHLRYDIPATARASFYIYNGRDDVDALVAALHKVVDLLGR
ncbi:MAG: cysteine desulfurase [Anaerolineales bacterium]